MWTTDLPVTPPSLSLDSILHPEHLFQSVLHPTSFFRSGWGLRPLTMDELGIAFGFPAWLREGGLVPDHFPIVPLQVMDACLRSVLRTQPFETPLLAAPTASLPAPSVSTWFPRIQMALPHSWIDASAISDKAAKRDDAAVPTAMWDLRVTLLYPKWTPQQGQTLLLFLRLQCMLRYCY